jgi:shikimate 5-dehydrogenase
MRSDDVHVVVIGAGQAGLAIGYYLARQGRRFVILDAAHAVGAAWRDRWDSFNTTGHELGGTIGIAVFGTIAAAATGGIAGPAASEGIANAFLLAALVAVGAGVIAVAALPRASRFLPKLRLHPQAMPMH